MQILHERALTTCVVELGLLETRICDVFSSLGGAHQYISSVFFLPQVVVA